MSYKPPYFNAGPPPPYLEADPVAYIAGYFFGAHQALEIAKESLRTLGGVYTVWDRRPFADVLIDVGLSDEDLGGRLADHQRESCWERSRIGYLTVRARIIPGGLAYSAYLERREVEALIRAEFTPPCGVF